MMKKQKTKTIDQEKGVYALARGKRAAVSKHQKRRID